jgi:hypothetical protein
MDEHEIMDPLLNVAVLSRVRITASSSKQMQPPPNSLPRVQSNGPHGGAKAEAVHHREDGRLLLYFAHAQHQGGRRLLLSALSMPSARKILLFAWPQQQLL